MTPIPENLTSRRSFLKHSTAAALAGAVAGPLILDSRSYAASGDPIKVGLVGCGGRGSGAAKNALKADPNAILVAMGDLFDDRLKASLANLQGDGEVGKQVQVTTEKCFTGFDAYKQVIDSGVDVVLLATPPGFRPVQLDYAVKANKHIFCEKPMATDAPGLRSVLASVEESRKRNISLVAGYCWRYSPKEQAGFAQVLDGAIGEVRSLYGTYLTGSLWSKPRQPGWTDMEWQIRNWLYFTWLSGDHFVEQAIHAVDWMCWAMKDEPAAKAVGLGGRQVRVEPEYGNIFDHFAVRFEWPNGAQGFIFCRQQPGCANDNSIVIHGSKGTAHILGFGGKPFIKDLSGKTVWRYSGPDADMYDVEHQVLFKSIRDGKPINNGARMVNSTMTGLLGRMVTYTGRELTWEEGMNSKDELVPKNFALDTPIAVPPVARPGFTKFA